jgi:hypothetical protein
VDCSVSPDGRRFLMIKATGTDASAALPALSHMHRLIDCFVSLASPREESIGVNSAAMGIHAAMRFS